MEHRIYTFGVPSHAPDADILMLWCGAKDWSKDVIVQHGDARAHLKTYKRLLLEGWAHEREASA